MEIFTQEERKRAQTYKREIRRNQGEVTAKKKKWNEFTRTESIKREITLIIALEALRGADAKQ